MTHRFNVNFSDSVWEVVGSLAEELEVDRAEVIRDAISLYWWSAREVKAGGELMVLHGGADWPRILEHPPFERLRPPKPPRPTLRQRLEGVLGRTAPVDAGTG